MGRFGPSAMDFSVERSQGRLDAHGPVQDPRKRPAPGGPLEARQPPAGVDAPPRLAAAGRQHAALRNEAQQLTLGPLAAAAGAGANRLAHEFWSAGAGSVAGSDTATGWEISSPATSSPISSSPS